MKFMTQSASLLGQTATQLLGIPPPTTNTVPQMYVDPTGDVWVADANVNTGNWRRARDALRSTVYRGTAYTTTAGSEQTFPFNTAIYDAYGMWNLSTGIFTAPIPGVYLFNTSLHFQAPSVSQRMYVRLGGNLATYGHPVLNDTFPGPNQQSIGGSYIMPMNQGDTNIVIYNTSTNALVCYVGIGDCWAQADFLHAL